MDEQLELEADIQQEMAASGDFVEGVMAFVQKRGAGSRAPDAGAAARARARHRAPGLNRIPARLAPEARLTFRRARSRGSAAAASR